MFFYQQVSYENPELILNISTFLYFWTKDVWTLLIMRINIIPAMIYFCFTQDTSAILCPLDPEKSSPIIKNTAFCHVERNHQEEQEFKPA